jgi:hypothetical protein
MSFVLVCDLLSKKTFCANLADRSKTTSFILPNDALSFINNEIQDFVEKKDGCKGTIAWDWVESNLSTWQYFFLQFDFVAPATPLKLKTPAQSLTLAKTPARSLTRAKTAAKSPLRPKTPKKVVNRELMSLLQGNAQLLSRRTRRRGGGKELSSQTIVTQGFAAAHQKKNDHVYLDIICSKKNGRSLLEFFLDYTSNFKTVELSALANVLAYYPKFGFEFKKGCSKNAAGISFKTPSYVELQSHIARQKEKNKPLPEDNFEAYEDANFLEFQGDLVNQGIGVKRQDYVTNAAVCGKQRPNESKRVFLRRLKAEDCAEDGYTMVKCRT